MEQDEELRHLRHGPAASDQPPGLVRYLVRAADPAVVTGRATEVLCVILELGSPAWPEMAQWALALPAWFVDRCRAATTPGEVDTWLRHWRTLDPAARVVAEAARGWTLEDWLYWLEPAERQWYWWDVVHHSDHSEVLVTVDGWPFADGALRWLLDAAGAMSVEVS